MSMASLTISKRPDNVSFIRVRITVTLMQINTPTLSNMNGDRYSGGGRARSWKEIL